MLAYTHLATPQDIASFDPNDAAKYRYWALFSFDASIVPQEEYDLMRNSLARHMPGEFLVVSKQELEKSPKDCYIRSVYHIFNALKVSAPFIAVAINEMGPNGDLLRAPVVQQLYSEDLPDIDYAHLEALNLCLGSLMKLLDSSSIDDFELPYDPTKSKASCCPNGKRIMELRKWRGPLEKVIEDMKGKPGIEPVSVSTLHNAENYIPIGDTSLNAIAKFFDVAPEDISFERLVAKKSIFEKLRKQAAMPVPELRKHFKNVDPVFFTMLENATSMPSEVIRFAYKGYCDALNFQNEHKMGKSGSSSPDGFSPPKFREILDIRATEELSRKDSGR